VREQAYVAALFRAKSAASQEVRARAALDLVAHLDAAQQGAEPTSPSPAAAAAKSPSGSKARAAAEQALSGCAPLVVPPPSALRRGYKVVQLLVQRHAAGLAERTGC